MKIWNYQTKTFEKREQKLLKYLQIHTFSYMHTGFSPWVLFLSIFMGNEAKHHRNVKIDFKKVGIRNQIGGRIGKSGKIKHEKDLCYNDSEIGTQLKMRIKTISR